MTLLELLALLLSGDLSAINDDELAAHEATLLTAFDENRAGRGPEAVTLLGQIADAADAVRNEAATRIETAENEAAAIADIEARLRPVVAEPEIEADPAPAAEATPSDAPDVTPDVPADAPAEPVLAAATTTRPRAVAPLSALASTTAPAVPEPTTQFRILGDSARDVTIDDLVSAMIDADRYMGGPRRQAEYMPVFNVQGVADPARVIERGNQAQIDSIVSGLYGRRALLAAGGFCGPAQPIYDLTTISQASTPLHDGLGGISAAQRGAVTFNRPLALSSFASAITQWTKDNDTGDDASPSEKSCVEITCTSQVTEEILAFARCLTITNFQDRYSPEFVTQALDLTMVQAAMQRETYLLDRVKAASTAVTRDNNIGAAADLQYSIGLAATGYRNSDRMLSDVGLVAILPAWVLNMYVGDVALAQHSYAEQLRMATTQAEANLRSLGVRPIFYIDSPSTGTSQKFAAQGAGALHDYPTQIQWGLAHEGAHVPLDGGPEINIGVARSPESNKVNTYQSFAETFEGYAFLGVKAFWVTQDVCPTGTFSAQLDIACEAS